MEKGWTKIQTYTNAIQGEIEKQMLEANGIPAVLLNQQDSSYMFGKINLFVKDTDVEQANRLMQEHDPEGYED